MAATTDGGPAFPVPVSADSGGGLNYARDPGMSLRDYFAGLALQGELASQHPETSHEEAKEYAFPAERKRLAGWCYAMADAMVAARTAKAGAA